MIQTDPIIFITATRLLLCCRRLAANYRNISTGELDVKHIWLVIIGMLVVAPVSAAEPIKIGNDLQLFWDDALIESITGDVAFVLQRPEPKEMILSTDESWEGNVSAYFTFLQDEDEYRAYYRGAHYDTVKKIMTHREVTCVVTSKDGIHWKKPKLGIVDFEGSTANNIVWDGIGTHCFAPFVDSNPDSKPAEKYKALSRGRYVKGAFDTPERQKGVVGLYTFVSADGLHWKQTSTKPVITKGAFDSQNLGFWDVNRNKYVCYSRLFIDGVRSIQFCESSDFVNWTDPVKLKYVDSPNEHLYTNAIAPYARNPKIYIGLPTRYLPANSRVEPLFMFSRDGLTFQRWSTAIIPESAPADRAGNRSNYAATGVLQLPEDPTHMSIFGTEAYYTGADSRVRRFEYRTDGFVALQAKQGVIVTHPVVIDGKAIFINARTKKGGSIVVSLLDAAGNPVPGYTSKDAVPFANDLIASEIVWRGSRSLEALAGKTVKLRISMTGAELFSLQVK